MIEEESRIGEKLVKRPGNTIIQTRTKVGGRQSEDGVLQRGEDTGPTLFSRQFCFCCESCRPKIDLLFNH